MKLKKMKNFKNLRLCYNKEMKMYNNLKGK